MFDNIGGKIQALAQIICWIGIIISAIVGLCVIGDSVLLGLIIIVIGFLSSWIGSFVMFGYGELIEATSETRDMTYELLHRKENNGASACNASTNAVPAGGWRCNCGRVNAPYTSTCVCGKSRYQQSNNTAQENKVHINNY